MAKKIKTHQGTAKRIKITRGGKMKRRKACQSHNLEKKSATRKRNYQKMQDVARSAQKRVRRLLAV
ncbi:MAG: 50S ribosomal protein L35 [Patescibacteria group bacterium]